MYGSIAVSRAARSLHTPEAPAKELARQMKQEEDRRTAQESAGSIDKLKFRR
jgi:hypothetical protein